MASGKMVGVERHLVGSSIRRGFDEKNRVVVVEGVSDTDTQANGSRKTGIKAETDVVEAAVSNRPSSFGKFTATRLEG
jgi:hypothetical protein